MWFNGSLSEQAELFSHVQDQLLSAKPVPVIFTLDTSTEEKCFTLSWMKKISMSFGAVFTA
jgi:hypothetical protein